MVELKETSKGVPSSLKMASCGAHVHLNSLVHVDPISFLHLIQNATDLV